MQTISRQPMHTPQAGLTLVEILIATVLGAVVVGTAVALVPKGAQQASTQAQNAIATAQVNKLTQAIEQQFKRGTFAGFAQGNASSLQVVFTTGSAYTLPKHDNLYSLNTLNVPGLDVPVGGEVLLVTSSGLAKLVKVTATLGSDRFTFDCPTGLPSNTEVKAFSAQSLGLSLSGNKLSRTVSGVSEALGDAPGASFAYVYQDSAGVLTRSETAAATTAARKLVGFMPVAAKDGIDRTGLVNLPESRFTRLLGCTENAASTLNDARLNVTISGLPEGSTPAVSLNGPDSNIDGEQPMSSQSYQGVKPGSYTMTANDVEVGENIYRAVVKGSPATLYNAWGDAYLQAAYSVVKGRVTFRIEGLPTPPPASGMVRLSGPEDKALNAENGAPELRLTPGDYAITADQIGDYVPNMSTSTLHITSRTDTEVVVKYAIPTGTVNFQITGLPTPPPENGFVRITGPENKNVSAVTGTADATFKAGSYTISADPIGLYEPVVTVDSKSQSSLTVIPKGSSTVRVNYALATGPLNIEVRGLPAGTSAPLAVSGPQKTTVNATSGNITTVTLQVGSYTVTAPEVTVGGTKYLPSPASATVSLSKGGAGHTVTYTAAPTTPETTTPGGTPPTTPTTTTPPDPTKVVFRVTMGYDDQNPTTVTLVNADTGQQYQAKAQSFSGFPAGQGSYIGEDGLPHKFSWSAKSPSSMIAEFTVDPGTYYISGFANQGNGYSMQAFGFQFDHIDGVSISPDKQQQAVGPTGEITNQINLDEYKRILNNYKSMYVRTRFDIKPGVYNITSGMSPQIDLGLATGAQFRNVECSALEILVYQFGCIWSP